jgi:glycerol kinase
MPAILAIDQSTSATKAILFDPAGRILDKAAREHRQIYSQPGWVEHDAEEIWQNVLAAIRELAGRNRDTFSRLAGLSVTNQRETIIVFERPTGRPLHPAIVWQCRRSEEICSALRAQGCEEIVRAKTGLKIDTYFSASKLKWLIAARPDLAGKLASGEAVISTMDGYLIHRLTKGAVFATDFTNASRTLLFNIGTLAWDPELCGVFDVPVNSLPEVRESAGHFGQTDIEGILTTHIPIVGVMGDSQASLFAQRCFSPGMIKATLGTGTSVLLNIGESFRQSGQGAVTALAWVWRGQPTYAFEGIINFSAATIEWLKNQLGLIPAVADIEALATAVPDNAGVYLVPAFAGLSAPYWSPEARAAIVGMTAHTRREHIVRAALEAIAYQIRDVLDMMRCDSGIELKTLRADGGPTRNGFLMQFIADIAGVEIEVSEVAESSAWGAALNGWLGLGQFQSLSELSAAPLAGKIFRPVMSPGQVAKNYAGWQAAVKRIL